MNINTDIKRNVLGIVAEYNPFHYGHMYQMKKCKELCGAEAVIVAMSGYFTQRGEPALMDKWTRARMAIEGGADLVLEIPFYYSCNSAEYFAKGAIGILDATGIVTHIGFGCESESMETLSEVAQIYALETKIFSEKLKIYLKKGLSFPKARESVLKEIIYEKYDKISDTFKKDTIIDVVTGPNNILAIEYIKQLFLTESKMIPIGIKRIESGYHESKLKTISSATAVRKNIKEFIVSNNQEIAEKLRNTLPKHVAEELFSFKSKFVFTDNEKFFELIRYRILTEGKDLHKIFSVGEGIENRIYDNIRKVSDRNSLINATVSRRYTKTRIERILVHILAGFEKDCIPPEYTRVLAFNSTGRKLLKDIKRQNDSRYRPVTNINRTPGHDYSLDIIAADLYNIIAGNDIYKNSEYVRQPVMC